MKKEIMINALIQDYGEYLEDYNEEQIKLIVNNGVFTYREAKEQQRQRDERKKR